MKKHYIFKFVLLLIPVAALTLMSNASGFSAARSGSPLDGGQTCAQCHNGGSFNASAVITTDIPDTGYLLDTDYTITVNTSSTSSRLGFQMAAENATEKIGSFTAGSGTKIVAGNISQSSPSSTGNWSVTWRSPSTDKGNVTFYAAVNATNSNFGTTGDQTVTATKNMPSLSTKSFNSLDFDMYPNPSNSDVTIDLPSASNNAKVEFFDYVGRLALSTTISSGNNKVNLGDLSSGIYMLKVSTDNKIGTKKFIKE